MKLGSISRLREPYEKRDSIKAVDSHEILSLSSAPKKRRIRGPEGNLQALMTKGVSCSD